MALLTILKGLPLTYNRDLQEDKEPVFDTVDTVSQCLSITAEMLTGLKFNTDTLAAATRSGFMTATDLADYLVLKNIPFRQAHSIVGKTVAYCIEKSKELEELSLEELRQFSSSIEDDVYPVLSVQGSVDSRQSAGGTSALTVGKALRKAEQALGIE